MNNIWYLIPARAGSKTIPKKNIRLLDGKPLISHVLEIIDKISEKNFIVVSTDDDEVKSIVEDKAVLHDRSKNNADDVATLDDVALEVTDYLVKQKGASEDDILITVQSTSPFLKADTLKYTVDKFKNSTLDTVLTVKDDRHLRWTIKNDIPIPLYEERVNRQQMEPTYGETGGIIASTIGSLQRDKTRIGEQIGLIEVGEKEGLDIDTYEDWARAEFWCNRIRIFIRVDGSSEMGFGHLYRALALAQNLTAHEVFFITKENDEYKIGQKFLSNHHYPLLKIQEPSDLFDLIDKYQPQVVINDILDTEQNYIEKLKQKDLFVVNFEDLGSGNQLADVVVNDLYPDLYPQKNHWYGVENAILNPNFEIEDPKEIPSGCVEHILIAYGGTDPNSLTIKALKALKRINFSKDVTVILGPANTQKDDIEKKIKVMDADVRLLQDVKNMAKLMKKADLALTSAGRTVTELMCLGVPTIAICQNMKEMRHNHATGSYGVVNLGLGTSVGSEVLAEHIQIYIDDVEMRKDMHHRMIRATRNQSNAAIVMKIINTYRKQIN
jgi:spore coat polysaccharide biosynthesis predicted glycosyltransferase SpsG/GTP:adenosylcobinamide-phosphate guanylyltransferase